MTKRMMNFYKDNAKAFAASLIVVAPLLMVQPVYSDTALSVGTAQTQIRQGEVLRDAGALLDAQKQFDQVIHSPESPDDYLAALTASGYNQFLLNNMESAEQQLQEAYQKSTKTSAYLHALASEYLGSLYLSEGADDQALRYFNEAYQQAKLIQHPELAASVLLLKANLDEEPDVDAIANAIAALPKGYAKARLQLQWAEHILGFSESIESAAEQSQWVATAYKAIDDARQVADAEKNIRFQSEATATLARLYFQQQRYDDALLLADRGLALASQLRANELTVKLNQLKGDCFKQQSNKAAAFQAYTLAMNTLALIKEELPINFPNGRSVVDALIDPVYRSYADLLMQSTDNSQSTPMQDKLITAVNSMEAVKKADLQDFFLNRCSMALDKHTDWAQQTFPGAAVLYPIVFDDRVELVLKQGETIHRRTVKVSADELNEQVDALVLALQSGKPYKATAKQLYQWLYAPVQKDLQQLNNPTLVYVPDRSIRGMPLAALFDGEHFIAEKNAVVTLPSLDLENLYRPTVVNLQKQTLIAGISKPDGGSVVPLPGVEKEVVELKALTHSQPLLNKAFTRDVFKANLESAQYANVHIASHGYFGKNVKDSYVMAYDHNLSLQDFESSLKAEKLKKNPIELLTLSACQTAQGNDRMLLGFSGLAVKSNALSAIGSLWPVNDEGTVQFMKTLYKGLGQSLTRSQAMQQAQVAMIKSKEFKHPYYWSPFVLVGNWQ